MIYLFLILIFNLLKISSRSIQRNHKNKFSIKNIHKIDSVKKIKKENTINNFKKNLINLNFFSEKLDIDSFEELINKIFKSVKAGNKISSFNIENYINNEFEKNINNYFDRNKIDFILSNSEVIELSDFLNAVFFPSLGISQPCILVPIAIFLANIYKKKNKIKKISEFFILLQNEKDFPIFYNFENYKDQVPTRDLWQTTITEIIKNNNKRIDDSLLWDLSTEYSSYFEKNSIRLIYQKTQNSIDKLELEILENELKNKKKPTIILFNLGKLNEKFKILKNYLNLNQKNRTFLQLEKALIETSGGHYIFFNGKDFINPLSKKYTRIENKISNLRDFYFDEKIFEIISEIPITDEIIELFNKYGKLI